MFITILYHMRALKHDCDYDCFTVIDIHVAYQPQIKYRMSQASTISFMAAKPRVPTDSSIFYFMISLNHQISALRTAEGRQLLFPNTTHPPWSKIGAAA